MRVRCPHCHNPIELVDDSSLIGIVCPSCESRFDLAGDLTSTFDQHSQDPISRPGKRGPGTRVGHFELVRRLGIGAFGEVWRARDSTLDRSVAIKIPRKGQLTHADSDQFVREARGGPTKPHWHCQRPRGRDRRRADIHCQRLR